MTRDDARRKVAALLALSKCEGAGEHEAAAAASAAARMMRKWELSADAVDDAGAADPVRVWSDEPIAGTVPGWQGALALGIAKAHGGLVYRDRSIGLVFIGTRAARETTRALYRWASVVVADLGLARRRRGAAARWVTDYRWGAVAGICTGVREGLAGAETDAREDAGADSRALAVVDRALVRLAEERAEVDRLAEGLGLGKGRKRRADAGAYAAGSTDGAAAWRARSASKLGAGSLRLGSGR